jgi:hypothetical protein
VLEIFAANLATEVVFPVPLTPITKIVVKPVSESANVRGLALSSEVRASRIASNGSWNLLMMRLSLKQLIRYKVHPNQQQLLKRFG